MEKYFTRDMYLDAKGIDLNFELHDDDNKSGKVERFIKQITNMCLRYLVKNYHAVELMDFEKLSEKRQQIFIDGCMEQADYVLNNGFVRLDTGISENNGFILDTSKVVMSKEALDIFWMGGFANIQGISAGQRFWEK